MIYKSFNVISDYGETAESLLDRFDVVINSALNDGWMLHGSPFNFFQETTVSAYSDGGLNLFKPINTLGQSMIKLEPE